MRHTCNLCALGFVVEEAYMMHMKVHSPESGEHECDICHTRLKSADILYRHKLRHYRRYRCAICHTRHKDKDSAACHVMTDHARQAFVCEHCGKGFKRPQDLKRHVEQYHIQPLQLECAECGRVFHERGQYVSHISETTSTKTNAQKCKEYRERKKLQDSEKRTSAKTASQRNKEYRDRLKFQEKSSTSTSAKSTAQRSKEYRERKKLQEQRTRTSAKSVAQRSKEYRERKKLQEQSSNTKSTARVKKYRDTNAINTLLSTLKADAPPSTSTSAKSVAQRSKEYRERKKLQEQSSNTTSTARVKKHRDKNAINTLLSTLKADAPPRKKAKQIELQDNTGNEDLIQTYNLAQINTNQFDDTSCNAAADIAIDLDEHINEDIGITLDGQCNVDGTTIPMYTNYFKHSKAHLDFHNGFKSNSFGHSCAVCDRLWWEKDLKENSDVHENILKIILPNFVEGTIVRICSTCKASLDKEKIPMLSTYNGFSYPVIPHNLPKLNLIEQRLISPRIPFMQIRRLRHVHGQCGIYGQIINVPVDVNTMVKQLPRNFDDDHCFYVHLKKKLTHKTSYVQSLINRARINEWLRYLVKTPLYLQHNITIDSEFLNGVEEEPEYMIDDLSEDIPMEDYLVAHQHTLLWNEDKILHVAPGENNVPLSVSLDEYAEELSFPTIYGGQFRCYKEGISVTPFMQATSEIRRTDRRGADPQHLLYLALKIMRLRVRDCISDAFKHVGSITNITKEHIQSEDYINSCIESNLAFLRCIPNSAWYWADRKKDLFAMIRQKGAPTAFMTLSANETGCTNLLKLLYKLKKHAAEVSDELLSQLNYMEKSNLVNEDAVTCAIYFNKLVNSVLHVLQSQKRSPFGKYRVKDYFRRIEFQHRGSPHAHILLWLDNVPDNLLNNCPDVISLIDELVSVSASEASGNIKLQTHKHTFTCYKNQKAQGKCECRFGAPFFPSKHTVTLLPMKESDADFSQDTFQRYKEHYQLIRTNLEIFQYADFNQFYSHNNIDSDDHYKQIIRAGITRPKLFYKRQPTEVWHNPFNPFVLHHLKSNMDVQIIQDEYSCAAYVVQCVNKSNRGISDLQRMMIQVMDEHPEFDILEITRALSVDVLHSIEMSSQEAAWFLLREPVCKSSIITEYVPTIYPAERHRTKKTLKELNAMDKDRTDIWKENWFDKYEKRPSFLEDVTLAQFVAKYYINIKGQYAERKEPKVIRYRNYDMANNFNDYRREMVLLHIPFRSEDNDILAENKFIQLYEDNKNVILERRKEFESNLDIEKTLEYCRQLCRDEEEDEELRNEANVIFETDPYDRLLRNPES